MSASASYSQQRLEEEIKALRHRLESAEEMRRAILQDEVDAFVVGRNEEERQVLLLGTASASYGPLVARMQQGVVTASHEGEILHANEPFAALLGEPLPRLFRASLHTYTAPPYRDPLARLLASGGSDDFLELDLMRPDGSKRRARVRLASRGEDYVSLLATDLSEQHRSEEAESAVEALRRGGIDGIVVDGERIELLGEVSRELQEAVQRKDQFIAVLGHELRNPLASIVNGLEILRHSPNLEPQSKHIVQVMRRQTATLVRLVDDLLDVNRLSQGKLSLERRRVDLRHVISDAAESAEPDLEAKRHTLELDLHPDPVWVQGDRVRLAQVILNLLSNAAKYTDAGGWIRVILRRGRDESARGLAVIRVVDSGIGIAPHHLAEIFEPFTQLPHRDGRAGTGLGLGLSICRHLIELHDGRISARSAGDNQGSEFVIELPEWPEGRSTG